MNEPGKSKKLRLYRGISVPSCEVDQVEETILSEGIHFSDKSRWRTTTPLPALVRQQAELLRMSPGKARAAIDEMEQVDMICACGDPYGGTFYALKHNYTAERNCPLLIAFEASIDLVAVDGKDFIYTAFQLFDQLGRKSRTHVASVLSEIYGKAVVPYFDEAASTSETSVRVGLCDLACYDADVSSAHSKNRTLVHGRCNTQFCSAFQVCLPIASSDILSVTRSPAWPKPPRKSVTLDDVR